MALDFPSSPSLNEVYTSAGKSWRWDGSGWRLITSGVGAVTVASSAADVLSVTDGVEVGADDPGADRLVFWDDSAGRLTHLSVGAGLEVVDTTISMDRVITTSTSDPSGGSDGDIWIKYTA